jgi:hypothetical protein
MLKKNLRAAMRAALRIHDRLVAEPLCAKTGRPLPAAKRFPGCKTSNPIFAASARPAAHEAAPAEVETRIARLPEPNAAVKADR